MDFKRIEWIFLVVFIGINIFLGIEIFQTPTLLSNSHTSSVTPSDLKTEIAADNISIPKVNNRQGDGYYLAGKASGSWMNRAKNQVGDNINAVISTDDNTLAASLNQPQSLSHNSKQALKEIEKFKNNPRNVYNGKKYVYVPELSGKGEYIFAQKTPYGEIYSTRTRLHIAVKNHQIVSYLQRYTSSIKPVRERQTTISSRSAIDSLYTYSELPNNSKVLWIKNAYSKLVEVRGYVIFLPTWVAAVQNNTTKSVSMKRVNGYSGSIIQQNNAVSEEKDDSK